MPERSDSHATIGSSVHESLRRDIIFGRLEPGRKLHLNDLKSYYNASVSTLREGLNRLVAEGFVINEGQRGFHVAPVTEEGLKEIADLRILIECHALKLSIEAGDTEWEGEIVSAHHKLHRMEQRMGQGDFSVKETWKQYDWEFHQALIGACGSQELLSLHGTVFDKYLRYLMRLLSFRGDTAVNEHRALLAAALDRDAGRAQEILRQHIAGGVEHSLTELAGTARMSA
jgi:DNA-binding GntR family transcriptional regulator